MTVPRLTAVVLLLRPYSLRGEASYRKDSGALREVLKTFVHLEPKSANKKN